VAVSWNTFRLKEEVMIRKLLLTCTALLLVMGLGPVPAGAQVCFDFVQFCDCLTLRPVGATSIEGTWENWDCQGGEEPLIGVRGTGPYPNPCGAPAQAKVVCAPSLGCTLGGRTDSFTFSFDIPLDGNVDMGGGVDDEFCRSSSPYTLAPGACPDNCGSKPAGLPPSHKR
jgi:hypothetical protein